MVDPANEFMVEVAYAAEQRQVVVEVAAFHGATLREVVEASGILAEFPEIDLACARVGIFGKPTDLNALVSACDRIEIYRPLKVDPKEARRKRARKGVRT